MAGGAQFDPSSDEIAETHEINVTPFIDVMLVLLIIFMVAAPLATVDVKVDLPKTVATAEPRPEKPLYLTLRADLSLALGDNDVSRDALGAALDKLTAGDQETRLFLRADRSVDYGALMDLMNDLRRAGYRKVALVGLDGGSPPPTVRQEAKPNAQ
jgi:biopolymer transport protein ExbD